MYIVLKCILLLSLRNNNDREEKWINFCLQSTVYICIGLRTFKFRPKRRELNKII